MAKSTTKRHYSFSVLFITFLIGGVFAYFITPILPSQLVRRNANTESYSRNDDEDASTDEHEHEHEHEHEREHEHEHEHE